MTLKELYNNTNYIIHNLPLPKTQTTILIGKKHQAIDDLGILSWTFITAWNPHPQILTAEENNKRNLQLKNEIQSLGCEFKTGIGIAKDQSWSEESYFVMNISEDAAMDLGRMFVQKAIVFGKRWEEARLIFLS